MFHHLDLTASMGFRVCICVLGSSVGVLPSPPCSLLLWGVMPALFSVSVERGEEDVAVLVTRRNPSDEASPIEVTQMQWPPPPGSEAQLRPSVQRSWKKSSMKPTGWQLSWSSVPCRSAGEHRARLRPRRVKPSPSAGDLCAQG